MVRFDAGWDDPQLNNRLDIDEVELVLPLRPKDISQTSQTSEKTSKKTSKKTSETHARRLRLIGAALGGKIEWLIRFMEGKRPDTMGEYWNDE